MSAWKNMPKGDEVEDDFEMPEQREDPKESTNFKKMFKKQKKYGGDDSKVTEEMEEGIQAMEDNYVVKDGSMLDNEQIPIPNDDEIVQEEDPMEQLNADGPQPESEEVEGMDMAEENSIEEGKPWKTAPEAEQEGVKLELNDDPMEELNNEVREQALPENMVDSEGNFKAATSTGWAASEDAMPPGFGEEEEGNEELPNMGEEVDIVDAKSKEIPLTEDAQQNEDADEAITAEDQEALDELSQQVEEETKVDPLGFSNDENEQSEEIPSMGDDNQITEQVIPTDTIPFGAEGALGDGPSYTDVLPELGNVGIYWVVSMFVLLAGYVFYRKLVKNQKPASAQVKNSLIM